MKTFVARFVLMPSLLIAVGCGVEELDDLSTTDDALNTCHGWHGGGNHRGHRHHRHKHHHHPRPHATGKAGTSGGMAGMGGGMAGMSGGMAGAAGGMAGMGGSGDPVDPRCAPVTGTVSWWHGDGDYDDAVGSNDGASAGAVSFVAGINDEGFGLNATAGSFVEVPNDASLQLTSAVTLDAWVSSPTPEGRVIDKVTAFSGDGYLLDIVGGGRLRLFVAGDSALSSAALPANTFTHVAGVYNGTTLAVYVNGALSAEVPTAIAAIPVSSLALRIGADSGGGSLFNGVIDEPRVYGRALSADEIALIAWQGMNCP
jgi:hypothetical protein